MGRVFFCLISLLGCLSAVATTPTIEISDGDDQFSIHIRSGNLHLRNPMEGDLEYYNKIFLNEKTMEKYMEGIPRPQDEIIRRFEKYHGNTLKKTPWNSYLVFKRESDEREIYIGHVMLEPSDRGNPQESELSYVLLPEFWNKGLCTQAVNILIDALKSKICDSYLLKGHRIETLYATARPDNPASCRVLEKNGFIHVSTEEKFGNTRCFYELNLKSQGQDGVTHQ